MEANENTVEKDAGIYDSTSPGDSFSVPTEKSEQPVEAPMFGKLEPLTAWRRVFIFIGLCLGLVLSIMDTSIISTAIYTIAVDFDSLAKAIWVVLAYELSYLGK